MAPGYVHRNVWKRQLLWVIPITLIVITFIHTRWTTLFALSFLVSYFSGKYIEPDLDEVSLTASDNSVLKDFPIVGYIFVFWWIIYALFINFVARLTGKLKGYLGGHRTIFSHSVFPGTVLRMIWLDSPFVLTITYFHWKIPYLNDWTIIICIILGQFAGLALNDFNHLKFDRKGITYGSYE
jgi:hypothetical protein